MSTLPDPLDYGKRQSAQSNRLDRPGTGSQAAAAALTDAISSFNSILEAKREKTDKLNYALVRNEILLADLDERNKLADDTDWKTQGKRYGEGFKTRSDTILSGHDFDPYDRQLLEAEVRLIGAKGLVDVGASSKKIEISQGYAKMTGGIAEAKEQIINAKTGDRNALMEGVLESINAAEEMGYFGVAGADTAEALRQSTTQDIAKAVLDSMDPAERNRLLRASQAYRRGYGIKGDYGDLIQSAAAKTGLPPELLAAQIDTESSGDPEAKSGAFGDPTGLMQLGEAAADEMGVTDRTDPRQSIDGGAAYLAKQLEGFDGDKAKALAAYNWGRGNVLEAFDKYGDGWLEHAPEETQKYVNKLLPYWEGTADPGKYLTATNTGGGPLTPEDIAEGKGTGSIADFLHSDTVAKMLESANREDKENREREESQSVVAEAFNLYPEDDAARMKYIAERTSGNVQKKAETDAQLRFNREQRAEAQEAQDLYDNYTATIRELKDSEQPLTMDDIPPDHLETMSESQIRDIEDEIKRVALGTQFAPVTRHFTPEGSDAKSLNMWKDMPAFGPGSKAEADLQESGWKGALDQDDWLEADALQRSLQALDKSNIPVPNVGPTVKTTLEAQNYGGHKIGTQEQRAMEARLDLRLQGEVARWQNANNQKATPTDINRILGEMMLEKAWDPRGRDRLVDVATATSAQIKGMYLPIGEAMSKPYIGTEPEYAGLTMYQFLQQKSKDLGVNGGKGADDDAIERAYFAHVSRYNTFEVEKRLRGQ